MTTDTLFKVKTASRELASIDDHKRNEVLHDVAAALIKNTPKILKANARDLQQMSPESPMYDRLLLNTARIEAIARSVVTVTELASPFEHRVGSHHVMPNGLVIEKWRVPFGVIAVIYESRPNVTVDVFALCFKSGNACALKGGKEAKYSNKALVQIIRSVLTRHGVNPDVVCLLPSSRKTIKAVIRAHGLVDVCIPRGGQGLIKFVRENARVPLIETGAGVVHTYFDASGDLEKGKAIVNNAKTRRVSVCNALDTLLVHKDRLKDLFDLVEPMIRSNVEIFADQASYKALEGKYPYLNHASSEDFGREFLSYKLAIKTVSSVDEATQHISHYDSGHSEAVIAEDKRVVESFLHQVDAAAVFVNTSTAFTDGGEFGMGSEIGISTQKLHARGPMGLDVLTTYKWVVLGDGQVRS